MEKLKDFLVIHRSSDDVEDLDDEGYHYSSVFQTRCNISWFKLEKDFITGGQRLVIFIDDDNEEWVDDDHREVFDYEQVDS